MGFNSLKHGEVFSVTNQLGDIDPQIMGSGLYLKDTRFLKSYHMTMNGVSPIFLTKSEEKGICHVFKLSNGGMQAGDSHYEKMDLEINRSQIIFDQVFYDHIEIINGSQKEISFRLNFALEPSFDDLFEVRGAKRDKRGKIFPVEIGENILKFRYQGLDNITRSLYIQVSEGGNIEPTVIYYDVTLKPGDRKVFDIAFKPVIDNNKRPLLTYENAKLRAQIEVEKWFNDITKISISNPSINKTLHQAALDMYMLSTDMGHGHFPVAGIPWFCVPFGRDSIIAAIQALVLNPSLAHSSE